MVPETFDPKRIVQTVEALQNRYKDRDQRHSDIRAVRDGDYSAFAKDVLPDDFPKPLVANLIDTAARDLAESMATLPTFACATTSLKNESAKARADKRSQIVKYYVQNSRLQGSMFEAADRFNTYGFFALIVDPDFKEKCPIVRIGATETAYYVTDQRGRCKQYAEVFTVPADQLCLQFPDMADDIRAANKMGYRKNQDLDVIRWYDEKCTAMILMEGGIALAYAKNKISRTPVRIVERPKVTQEVHGQFDDVIWVQVARAMMANYTMSAIDQAVNAPIKVPMDVNQLQMGPLDAIQTDGQVERVRMDLPQGLFPEQSVLTTEQMVGSRYPQGRSGSIDASIITGQGVEALAGVFQTQIATFQRLTAPALEDVTSMCLELDESIWGGITKSTSVKDSGKNLTLRYTPSKDIAGDYSTDVSYGAVAGLDPNRALVFLLQALAANLISKDTTRRHLPVNIDVANEEKQIDLEVLRESMLGSIATLPQVLPGMVAQGADPTMMILQLIDAYERRQKGEEISEVLKNAFAPEKPEAEAAAPPPAPGMPGGAPPQSPGQDLLSSLVGMTPGGSPNLQASVMRQQPI